MNLLLALFIWMNSASANVYFGFEDTVVPSVPAGQEVPQAPPRRPAPAPRQYETSQPAGSGQYFEDDGYGSSETVRPQPEPTPAEVPVELPVVREPPGPQAPPRATPRPVTPSQSDLSDMIDCPNCEFPRCNNNQTFPSWARLSQREKVAKVIRNVNTMNTLQGTSIDPRFMLCIANRESTLNPMVVNCTSSASGLLQVIRSTAEFTVARGELRSKLPGFQGISGNEYHRKMAISSLAQTELSLMVMATKAKIVGERDLLYSSRESVEGYAKIARAYYGLFQPGQGEYNNSMRYQAAIKSCYQCMTVSMSRDGRPTGDIETCLRRAKQ